MENYFETHKTVLLTQTEIRQVVIMTSNYDTSMTRKCRGHRPNTKPFVISFTSFTHLKTPTLSLIAGTTNNR